METDRHITLKRLALAYLVARGFDAAALEVRCPASRYRVDAAGYLDTEFPETADPAAVDPSPEFDPLHNLFARGRDKAARRLPEPRTVIIECKQARSDFLRDRRNLNTLLAERERLHVRRSLLEERLMAEHPELRASGTFLFSKLEEWDFGATGLRSYRKCLRDLRRIDRQLHSETKFYLAAQHRLADRLYLLMPRGVVKPRETPVGWGLIEAEPGLFRGRPKSLKELGALLVAGDVLKVRKRAPDLWPPKGRRGELLRNIAVAATRDLARPSATTERTLKPSTAGLGRSKRRAKAVPVEETLFAKAG